MAELIQADGIFAGYAGSTIIEDVSFSLDRGQGLALLGRNGMGKTTLLRALMGCAQVYQGAFKVAGKGITSEPSHRRADLGLGWVPQERGIFGTLSVEENLTIATRPGEWTLPRVYDAFPRLRERHDNMGNQLSGGELQMLAMGRALMLNPKVLVLDEPLEGLAPIIAKSLFDIIKHLVSEGGLSFIIVEQDARRILPITDKALVLESGKSVYSGQSEELLSGDWPLDRWLGVAGSGAESS